MANFPPSSEYEPSFPLTITEGDVELTLSPDQLYVEFLDNTLTRDISAVVDRYQLEPALAGRPVQRLEYKLPCQQWLKSAARENLGSVIAELREDDRIRSASPVYHRADLLPMETGHGFADDLLIRFAPHATEPEALALIESLQVAVVDVFHDLREGTLYHLKLENALQDIFAVADAFTQHPLVCYAGPNWIQLQSPASAMTPDDTHFPAQWNLSRIRAREGWRFSEGDPDVVIAVVDSGCDLTHPDLVNKYVAAKDRFDAIDNSNSPDDRVGHGTGVAGAAAAETNNKTGVAGVAPNCRLMPIRLFDSQGMNELQIINSIDWARNHGAHVVNMSWYYTAFHRNADIALNNAYEAGIVLIAASGNCKQSDSCAKASIVDWPAAHKHVIAVGAIDQADRRKVKVATDADRWDSKYGPELSVVAPAPIPWTTAVGGGYGDFWGTSAAAPQVAGLAALLFSVIVIPIEMYKFHVNSSRWKSDLVRSIIESTAAKVGGYNYVNTNAHPSGSWHEEVGYGRIDMAGALAYAWRRYRPSYEIPPRYVWPWKFPPLGDHPDWNRLPAERRDVLFGLAVTELADHVSDPEVRLALGQAGWAAVERTAQRMGRNL